MKRRKSVEAAVDHASRIENVNAALERAEKVCRRRESDGELIAWLPVGKPSWVEREHLATTFALGVLAEEVRRLQAPKRSR